MDDAEREEAHRCNREARLEHIEEKHKRAKEQCMGEHVCDVAIGGSGERVLYAFSVFVDVAV